MARERAGMSVEILAGHLGVTAESVRDWESDLRQPRANRLVTMAGVLGSSVSWLLDGEGIGTDRSAEPTPEDLRARIELARALIQRGLLMLEGVEDVLDAQSD